MKKILLPILIASSMFADTQVFDNIQETVHINISNSDVNRLVFPYDIKYQANSKEKDLTISVVDKEMFVKFTPYIETVQSTVKDNVVQSGKPKILYDKSKASELFIVTEKKTYSIVLHPVKKESSTVFFNESFEEKKKAIFINKDAEYVENITNNILKPAMTNQKIDGFDRVSVTNDSHKPIHIASINTILTYKHAALYKGYRYYVYEYEIKNPNEFILAIPDSKEILNDVVKTIKKKIIAYTIYYDNRIYKMLPKGTAKLLIVTEGDIND